MPVHTHVVMLAHTQNYYFQHFRHKSICGRRQTAYHGTATADDAFSESEFATDPGAFPWLVAVRVGDDVCTGVYVSHRDNSLKHKGMFTYNF